MINGEAYPMKMKSLARASTVLNLEFNMFLAPQAISICPKIPLWKVSDHLRGSCPINIRSSGPQSCFRVESGTPQLLVTSFKLIKV